MKPQVIAITGFISDTGHSLTPANEPKIFQAEIGGTGAIGAHRLRVRQSRTRPTSAPPRYWECALSLSTSCGYWNSCTSQETLTGGSSGLQVEPCVRGRLMAYLMGLSRLSITYCTISTKNSYRIVWNSRNTEAVTKWGTKLCHHMQKKKWKKKTHTNQTKPHAAGEHQIGHSWQHW